MSERNELIDRISNLVSDTHNEQDIKDLQTFSTEELKVILSEILEELI
jgi:hypothetical protein